MADINQVITLGIGTPSDVPHFVLVGLSPDATPAGPFNPIWAINSNRTIGLVIEPK